MISSKSQKIKTIVLNIKIYRFGFFRVFKDRRSSNRNAVLHCDDRKFNARLGFSEKLMRAIYDPLYIEFIAGLRAARKARGYSQGELASQLHKPQSYVSKVETCERRIDVIEAARWCMVLGFNLEDLLPASMAAPRYRGKQ